MTQKICLARFFRNGYKPPLSNLAIYLFATESAALRALPNQLRTAAFAVLASAVCGCGTMANMYSSDGGVPPRMFGGLATDFESIGKGDALGIIDLPGSLVGDIVTLPDVLVANVQHKRTTEAVPEELNGDVSAKGQPQPATE